MTYTGIAIGPLYKTLRQTRKTRELWAASFTFSLIARLIIEQVKDKLNKKDEDFILPDISDWEKMIATKGVGIFPDRIIFKSAKGDFINLNKILNGHDGVIGLLAEKLSEYMQDKDAKDLQEAFDNYFRLYAVEKEVQDGQSIINSISKNIDSIELQNKIPADDKALEELTLFFTFVNNLVNKKDETFLSEYYDKPDSLGEKRIPSLAEIATNELSAHQHLSAFYKELVKKSFQTDDDGLFIKELQAICKKQAGKSNPSSFKSYHKYICILTADGDKIGTTLDRLKDGEERYFSKKLINWGFNANKRIREYGGVPIYIGGDDLLCFVPVANNSCHEMKNVIELINAIKSDFDKQNFPVLDENKKASLSFGLSISYYKFPMAEALGTANELLREAKDEGGGNSVKIKLRKHSGSEMDCMLNLGEDSDIKNNFEKLMNSFTKMQDKRENSFLNSVMYHIRENEAIYELMAGLEQQNAEQDRIWNFICNIFDVAKKKRDKPNEHNPKGDYLLSVKDLMKASFTIHGLKKVNTTYPGTDRKVNGGLAAIKEIYSLLRTARFIKGLEDADK
jgi:CRISPR-associated protein Cmr2